MKINLLDSKDRSTRKLWKLKANSWSAFFDSGMLMITIVGVLVVTSFRVSNPERQPAWLLVWLIFPVAVILAITEGTYKEALWMAKGWYYLFSRNNRPIVKNIELTKQTLKKA